MKDAKPYIERVLDALYHFSQKQDTIKTLEIFQWITPKIKESQLKSALSNYSNLEKPLITRCGLSTYDLNRKNIEEFFNDFSNGNVNLWKARNTPNRNNKKIISWKGEYSLPLCICAVFAAYNRHMTSLEIREILNLHGYNFKKNSIYWALRKSKNPCAIKVGEHRNRSGIFEMSVKRIVGFGPDILKKILPKEADSIDLFFSNLQHECETETLEAQEKETIGAVEAVQAAETVAIDHDAMELETIDAANVGAAIISYIRKLQIEVKEAKSPDLKRIKADYEQKKQIIINQNNQIASFEGQIKKLKDIIESQNQKIIETSNELNALRLKNEREKSIPATFKVSEVARMTKLIKAE